MATVTSPVDKWPNEVAELAHYKTFRYRSKYEMIGQMVLAFFPECRSKQ